MRRLCASLMKHSIFLCLFLFVPLGILRNCRIYFCNGCWIISRDGKNVKISRNHYSYVPEIASNFYYFFNSVMEKHNGRSRDVDFSRPDYHLVRGYNKQLIRFPAMVESIYTIYQYINLSKFNKGSVVLDIVAYSGFTSILFDEVVGEYGKVIAIEADPFNVECINDNFSCYNNRTGRSIDLVNAAVWNYSGIIQISCEGNLGSHAAQLHGYCRANREYVKSITLDDLAEMFSLTRVDFIKCDIEGAESVIFDRPYFFERFRPRIVAEVHRVNGVLTSKELRKTLEKLGYTCREVRQIGSRLPLMVCLPQSC